MTYTPNFNDPRIRNRCQQAIAFVERYVVPHQECSIARTQLYRYLGNTSRPLGNYLLAQLLEVTDPYYNFETGRTKRYRINRQGLTEIRQAIGQSTAAVAITAELEQQLNSGSIEYQEKSDRLYNTLQYIPRQQRNQLLNDHGYRYHYDIQAAAPCLLLQRAQNKKPLLQLPNLSRYIANRSLIREIIAQECLISQEQVKTAINAVLQGGILTTYNQSQLFRALDYSYPAVAALRSCQEFVAIRDDIRLMWQALRDQFPTRTTTTRSGLTKRVRVSAREKSQMYRELENQVGRAIRRLLKKKSVRALWIHDGWVCDEIVDPDEIVREVRKQTGYWIQLDWTKYEDL